MLSLTKIFFNKALVLMYHRIASPETDPWELAVSASNFEQQLQVLKRRTNICTVHQLVDQLQQKKLSKRCAAITFDDGYIDNFTTAKPILEKLDLPATFFITTKNLGQPKEFWWDELADILLHTTQLPQHLCFSIGSQTVSFDLGNETILTEEMRLLHRHYVAYNPPTLRSKLYFQLWEKLSPLQSPDQEQAISFLRNWAGKTTICRADYRSMSTEQVREIASNPLFTIGGHTATHPALSYHPREVQQSEIRSNKQQLEEITGGSIHYFAYPSGNYNPLTIEVLKQSGFRAAFTTNPQPVYKKTPLFEVNRLQVNNWTGEQFEKILQKWLRQ